MTDEIDVIPFLRAHHVDGEWSFSDFAWGDAFEVDPLAWEPRATMNDIPRP